MSRILSPGRRCRGSPRWRRRIGCGFALTVLAVGGARPCAAAESLKERILEEKYPRGDYGFYLGWHDPWGAQFDDHASYALPFGIKVRFRWGTRFRLEADFSYYRRSSEPNLGLSVFLVPQFDALMVAGTFQVMLVRSGHVRPYVGAGPVFVSLADDFIVQNTKVPEQSGARLELASWSELDLGSQVVAGIDFPLGHRGLPFVEFRELFGKKELDEIRIGAFRLGEEFVDKDGRLILRTYDWSGPIVMAGLKIYF